MLESGPLKMEVSFLATSDERPKTPEERLMAAVLEEALATFERGIHSHNPMTRQASREVDRWVRSRDIEDLFSFENVCTILELDADCLREGLAELKRRARVHPHDALVRKLRRTRITDRRVWRGHIG